MKLNFAMKSISQQTDRYLNNKTCWKMNENDENNLQKCYWQINGNHLKRKFNQGK